MRFKKKWNYAVSEIKAISEWKLFFNQSKLEIEPKFLKDSEFFSTRDKEIGKLKQYAKRLLSTSKLSLTRTALSSAQKLSECVHAQTHTYTCFSKQQENVQNGSGESVLERLIFNFYNILSSSVWAAVIKYHKLSSLQKTEFYFSEF